MKSTTGVDFINFVSSLFARQRRMFGMGVSFFLGWSVLCHYDLPKVEEVIGHTCKYKISLKEKIATLITCLFCRTLIVNLKHFLPHNRLFALPLKGSKGSMQSCFISLFMQ
jgi:hypothetical protein